MRMKTLVEPQMGSSRGKVVVFVPALKVFVKLATGFQAGAVRSHLNSGIGVQPFVPVERMVMN